MIKRINVGVDTEYNPDTKEVYCVCYSYILNGTTFKIKKLGRVSLRNIITELNKHIINLKIKYKFKIIFLMYFTPAEACAMGFNNDPSIKNVVVIYKSICTMEHRENDFEIIDLALLKPGGLVSMYSAFTGKEYNKLLDLSEVKIEDAWHKDKELVLEYCAQDALKCVEIYDAFIKLCKEIPLPIGEINRIRTASSLGEKIFKYYLKLEGLKLDDIKLPVKDKDYFPIIGARTECYNIGIFKGDIKDYDITSAYLITAINLFRKHIKFKTNKTSNLKTTTNYEDIKDNVGFIAEVEFEFKNNIKYPFIPCKLRTGSVIFPLKGSEEIKKYKNNKNETVTIRTVPTIGSFEYKVYLNNKHIFKKFKVIKFLYYPEGEYEDNKGIHKAILRLVLDRKKYKDIGKFGLAELMKLASLSIYGKMCQGLARKTSTNYYDGSKSPIPLSKITNGYIANLIISGCRAIISETLLKLEENNIKPLSVTVDGNLLLIDNNGKVDIINTISGPVGIEIIRFITDLGHSICLYECKHEGYYAELYRIRNELLKSIFKNKISRGAIQVKGTTDQSVEEYLSKVKDIKNLISIVKSQFPNFNTYKYMNIYEVNDINIIPNLDYDFKRKPDYASLTSDNISTKPHKSINEYVYYKSLYVAYCDYMSNLLNDARIRKNKLLDLEDYFILKRYEYIYKYRILTARPFLMIRQFIFYYKHITVPDISDYKHYKSFINIDRTLATKVIRDILKTLDKNSCLPKILKSDLDNFIDSLLILGYDKFTSRFCISRDECKDLLYKSLTCEKIKYKTLNFYPSDKIEKEHFKLKESYKS
jgi:hypothetical protein